MGVHSTPVTWVIGTFLTASLVVFVVPALAPAAYLAASLAFFVTARFRLPLLRAEDRRPWLALIAGTALLVISAITRSVHGSLTGETNPLPSPADLLAFPGYGLLILTLVLLVRAQGHRHRRWRREATIDGAIIGAAFAVLIFATVLSPYISDAAIPADERLVNAIYSVLTIVLLANVARAAIGTGTNNRSWQLVALGAFCLSISDLLILLDTAGSSWASRPAGSAALLSFAGGSAALLHPHALTLSRNETVRPPALSTARILMLGVAFLIVPITLLLPLLWGQDPEIPVVIAGSVLLAGLSLTRIWILFAANQQVGTFEAALRDASGKMISAASTNEALRVAHATANTIIGDAGKVSLEPLELYDDLFTIGTNGSYIYIGLDETPDDSQTIALRGLDAQLISAIRGIGIREAELSSRVAHQISALVEQSADLVFVLRQGTITFASPNVARVLGAHPADLVETSCLELIHSADHDCVRALIANPSLRLATPGTTEARIVSSEGVRWFDMTARDFSDDPEVAGVVLTARDVTEERAAKIGLRRSEQWFRGLVQHSSDVIAVLDVAGVFTYASPAADDLFGIAPTELQGRTFIELLDNDERNDVSRVRTALASGPLGVRNLEVVIVRPDGTNRTAEVTITDLRNDPSVNGLVLNIRDVTDRKKLEDDLRYQALHDDLTGLGSRIQFHHQLTEALGPTRRKDSMVAALFIDIDDFKTINDSLGHAAGDQVLVEISSRLQSRLRLHDRAARFGGDEFAVVVSDVYSEGDITGIADRILEELSVPVTLHGQAIRIGVSVGIAIDEDGRTSPDDLIRAADVAMYEAKEQGKGRWAMFESSMADQTLERFELGNSLGQAIENDELMVYYQPIVDLGSGKTLGVEALVRWNHPVRGMVGPGQFIPIAEKNGLIVPLGRWVLEQAVHQVAKWRADGHDIYASVNISAVQLQRAGIVAEVLKIVDAAGMDRHAVVLELTESALINDFDLVNERIEALRKAGLRVAIDDFGTGYASLTYVDQFAADILKIDQSFVAKLEASDESAIVSTVLSIAKSMGAKCVAEGIEVPEQHRRLLALGCSVGQGYYFTRPAPAQAITSTLLREVERETLTDTAH